VTLLRIASGGTVMAQTLYDKYGGFSTISKIVHDLYKKVQASDILSPYFEKVDMSNLINHQIQFFSTLLGGPVTYDIRQIDEIHKRLNITDEAFQDVIDLLSESLEDAGMDNTDAHNVIGELETYRKSFVNHTAV
jgi:hemoglobin